MSAAELELVLKKISDRQDIYRSKIKKWSRREDMGDEIKTGTICYRCVRLLDSRH